METARYCSNFYNLYAAEARHIVQYTPVMDMYVIILRVINGTVSTQSDSLRAHAVSPELSVLLLNVCS